MYVFVYMSYMHVCIDVCMYGLSDLCACLIRVYDLYVQMIYMICMYVCLLEVEHSTGMTVTVSLDSVLCVTCMYLCLCVFVYVYVYLIEFVQYPVHF